MPTFDGYHAAKRRRSEYGDGFYFTDDFATADRFGPVVSAYRIHLRKPLHADQFELGSILAERSGTAKPKTMRAQGAWITKTARALGHDGIVLQMVTGPRYIIAFSPSQIRYQKPEPPPEVPQGPTLRVRVGPPTWEPAF